MKRSVKQCLSLLLSILMLLSLLPVTALGAAETNADKILSDAYALEPGTSLSYTATLTGMITAIKTPYDSNYQNITVIIEVSGYADKPIVCYRLKGEGADKLFPGDIITVTGTITNYNGTIEFAQGCSLDNVFYCDCDCTVPPADPKQIVAEAYALAEGATLPYPATLTGVITEVGEYNEMFENITVYMTVEGRSFRCYNMRGEGVADLTAGDTITVTGYIKNFYGTIEFEHPTMDAVVKGESDTPIIDGPLLPLPSGKESNYRVVGNADWMGNWDPASDKGRMVEVEPGVYQVNFRNVPAGRYQMKVTQNGSWEGAFGANGMNCCFTVTEKTTITVTFTLKNGIGEIQVAGAGVLMPGDLAALGDVNLDGKINVGDVARLYAHVRQRNPIIDIASLECADFNADGRINIGDPAKIYAYVRGTDPAAIVDEAYNLAENTQMSKASTLTGAVTAIIEPYNAKFNCVTLVMAIPGREDKPIVCSRLMGDGVANVAVGDTVTVSGTLRNFYGSVEFAEGCTLKEWVHVLTPEEAQAAIVEAAYALPENTAMDHAETLTGQVISVDQAYSSTLPYICITIAVPGKEDKPIGCYRLVGDGIQTLSKNDTVTVTGTLRNFYGSVEFSAGCQLVDHVSNSGEIVIETDPIKIVDAAYALKENTRMAYDVTLTGKVSKIKDAYSPEYQNITVEIQVAGRETKPILCYRMKGTGVDKVAKGDTITVTGRLWNYYGSIEFDAGCVLDRLFR